MSKQGKDSLGQLRINPDHVPERFRLLIPYVEKWGISDDGYLDELINNASLEELKELITVVAEFNAEGFDQWLGNPRADNRTREWVAFISLINAYDLSKIRLNWESEDKAAG